MKGFEYRTERFQKDEKTLAIEVPAQIESSKCLLSFFAETLHFPNYFGHNWDALDECLLDLEWLKGIRKVIIWHTDIPLIWNTEECKTYLKLLYDVTNQLTDSGAEIIVVFPYHLKGKIESIYPCGMQKLDSEN